MVGFRNQAGMANQRVACFNAKTHIFWSVGRLIRYTHAHIASRKMGKNKKKTNGKTHSRNEN